MWDEEINKKIKDAADQYHPAYDDSAWDKMEQLLDEHLPLKKDRRRIIYILPLVLLLAGVLFFVNSRKEITPSSVKTLLQGNPGEPKNENQKIPSEKVIANPKSTKSGSNLVANVKGKNELQKEPPVNVGSNDTKKIDKSSSRDNTDIVNRNTSPISKNQVANNQEKQKEEAPALIQGNSKENSSVINSTAETVDREEKPSNRDNKDIAAPSVTDNAGQEKATAVTIAKDEKELQKSKDVAKTVNPKNAGSNAMQKKNFLQNFGIGLSVGPDVSAVKLNNTGKVTLDYGAELSYSFSDKFTLKTGFYVSKKIYSVDDDEYHVPPGSTWNAFLQSVDANCKVYEVPLVLSYNFGKTKNHNWFASAGLSSYFMKRESYVYYYKTPLGVSYHTPWTITNQNKHYFSVLDISGGYKYSINKRFSILAEPYVKLPLSGIGVGKIKLNSGGVLFTVAVKPF